MASASAGAPTTPFLAADVPQTDGRANLRAVFDAFVAEVERSRGDATILSAGFRREAFHNFERIAASGGKPGRDWKHDYTRVGTDIPRHEKVIAEAWEPLVAADASDAWLWAAYPAFEVRHNAHAAKGLRLDAALEDDLSGLVRTHLGRAVRWRDDKFASLALAFLQNAIVVHVPAGLRVERPIVLTHDISGTTGSSFPYTVVVIDDGAEATILEDALGASAFSSGIVEAIVADRARLNYVAVQRADADTTVLMNRGAVCGKDATCRWYLAELGGALSRSVVTTRLEGRGASSEITGFFFNDGDQHVDLSSLVEHAVGDSVSRTTIKSAAKDRGQGRYIGNIRIGANANGSDAALRDDALLISQKAHIDSVPALEIASNDVKAFHGATVGSIDEEELFYAQSRGIERHAAERMIALGFFEPAVSVFPIETVRDFLRTRLAEKA